jgi:hypothetical protein
VLHDDAGGGDVAFHVRPSSQLDDAKRANAAMDLALHVGGFYFDVGSHHSVLADLEPLAVQDVAVEFTLDPERSRFAAVGTSSLGSFPRE